MWTSLLAALVSSTHARDLRVVATVPTLAAWGQEVVGDHGRVTAMALHTQDPHFVDARPSLALELARADVVLLTGLDLEVGWLPTLLTGSRNARVQPGSVGHVDCSTPVTLLGAPSGPVDRAMGDIHAGGNPHYHADPRAARVVVPYIAQRLGAADPDHADAYAANAEAFVARLDEAMTRWTAQAAPLRGQPVIDFHRAWPYVEDWLGFRIVADIEPKPGIPPTPKHLLHVVQLAEAEQVALVIQESWFPSQASQTVADRAGARLAVLHAQTDFQGGQTYIAHVDALVGGLVGP